MAGLIHPSSLERWQEWQSTRNRARQVKHAVTSAAGLLEVFLARQQPSAHPQNSQPGSYQPGASAPSDYGSYGTTPPATGYGYGAPS